MKLSTNQLYRHEEIKELLCVCPICNSSDAVAVWSTMYSNNVDHGREGITCSRCNLDLAFIFRLDSNHEIIDAYELDHFKIGKFEFKNDNKKLLLYLNNTYVRDIANDMVDFDNCKNFAILS